MAGLITYSSVLLLARKRLERVEKLLRAKLLTPGAPVNEIERQVLFLARTALRALNHPPAPTTSFDANTFTPWLAQGISQFAVMGSVGPELTRFAAHFAPGQAWLYDTLRSGNPDPGRSQVLARSTDFLLKFCAYVLPLVQAEADKAKRLALLEHMRAYALGHACYIAGAVVSAPYVDAVEFEPGSSAAAPPRVKLSVQAVRGALEEAVSRQVYRRDNPRGGDWSGWLPNPDQVPSIFFDAYSAAATVTYGPGARVAGAKAFNDQLARDQPPALSVDLLRDGYGTYRLLTERGYAWTYGDWLVAILFMFIPPLLMFPFSALLPQGRHLRRDGDDAFFDGKPQNEQRDGERALFEVMTFPLAANALTPLIMMIWLMAGSYLGAGKETIFGLINAIIGLVLAVAFFATLGSDVPAWARWIFFFFVPLGLCIAHIAYVLGRGGQDKRHWQVAMSSISLLVIAIVFVICFVGFLHFGVEDAVEDGADSGEFWGYAVLWLVIVVVLWLIAAGLLTILDNSTPGVTRNDFAGGRRHFLRLFDDTTLGQGPLPTSPPTPVATLAQRLYPTERQPLLKLWWTGAGRLFVRSDRDALVFAFAADGSGTTQAVLAPIAPMSAIEFGELLKKSVKDNAGNFSGELKFERFVVDEPLDPQLGTGQVFADHGDDQTTIEAQAAERPKFKSVPVADQLPYVLHLAPRRAAAVHFGAGGALLPADSAAAAAVVGAGNITLAVAAGSADVVGDAATRFGDFFVPGDVIETTGLAPNEQARVVTDVRDDQHLTVNLAFGAFAAASTYRRRARDREADFVSLGQIANSRTVFRQIVGTAAAAFDVTLKAGDTIVATPPGGGPAETRVVTAVVSPTLINVDAPFSVVFPDSTAALPWAGFVRPGRLSEQGINFAAADPTPLFAGSSLLDRAADLATLLCLGTASHMLLPAEQAAVAIGDADQRHAAVIQAQQVFRNWNLDHRRVAEWRMLVGGGAVSEKHGNADRADAMQPALPAALRTLSAAGEPLANQLGWTTLFAGWLDMAHRPGNDSHAGDVFTPGGQSNLKLSQAVAYLLNLPTPA